MSHLWFGDWVSLHSWGDSWRNEGFATYVALMWANRENPQQLDQAIAEIAQRLADNPSGYPLNNPPAEEMFGRDSYNKGAVLVHQLRQEMGDEAFFNGLKIYFQRFGGGSASQAEFQSVMEEAVGHSLDEFFKAWFE
jgi:aminopeptidase N